ncbi:MAG TPA: nucleoside hydrolase [Chthoniobacterales bacterium]
MQFRKLTFVFVCAAFSRFAAAETVWIDTDVSIGSPIREVDDAYAIVLALHSPEIRIAGISTSYGNAPLGHTTHAARELIEKFGAAANLKPDQVFAGARSAADLGEGSAASDALETTLKKNSLTYIALGPLTNLATFLQLHPKTARKINRVLFVGGEPQGTSLALGPGGSFRVHDANVFKDPRAVSVVVRSGIPLTFVPISAASNLLLNEEDLRQLEQQRGAGNYLSRRSKVWLWFWTHAARTKGGPIFDALAVVASARPDLVTIKPGYARIDEAGHLIVTRGLTNGGRPAGFCSGFAPATKTVVMRRLAAGKAE